MDFMANILPTAIDRWNISNGSMTEKQLLLHPGGSAVCALDTLDIAYIPKAFQVRARHNANIDWKKPNQFARINIVYEDGDTLLALVPLNTTSVTQTEKVTTNVTIVESKTYAELTFSITNTLDEELILTLYELRPSLDLDESLYNSIESKLPQLVYAYNDGNITAQPGIETLVVQLPVSVNKDTNLLLHLSITGQTSGGTLTCTVNIDGETVRSFPIKQTTVDGEFYLGVPSLLAFVKKGNHVVTAQIKTTDSIVTVPKENALIVLDGKGVLGGASGEYPHAEVTQEIRLSGMYNNFAQDVLMQELVPDTYAFSTVIGMLMRSFKDEMAIEVVRRGEIVEFGSLDAAPPPIEPYDSSVLFTDMYGMFSSTTYETNTYEKRIYKDCVVTTTDVDTSKYAPIYSSVIRKALLDHSVIMQCFFVTFTADNKPDVTGIDAYVVEDDKLAQQQPYVYSYTTHLKKDCVVFETAVDTSPFVVISQSEIAEVIL